MFCKNCGKEIDDNAAVCVHCGVLTTTQQQAPVNDESKKNTMATVGFVFSFLVAIVGLICSIIGLNRASKQGLNGKGLAIAGIIISAANMLLGFIYSMAVFSELMYYLY